MNAPTKPVAGTTMSANEFNRHTGRAKRAAASGPVFITERGKPSYVLLTEADFQRLSGKPKSLLEALADPNAKPTDPDLMEFIPERRIEPVRFAFDEEE